MKAGGKFEIALLFALGFLSALAVVFAFFPPAFGSPGASPQNGFCALAVRPVFSPGAQEEFVSFVDSASQSLDVMLYQFSNPDLKDALARAVKRGVRVRIILEPRVDANYPTGEFLAQSGASVRWATTNYTNTHSKTAVADGKKVLVGSTNWSRQAMRSNRESSVIVESEGVAREFERVFEEDWAKAKDFVSQNASIESIASGVAADGGGN